MKIAIITDNLARGGAEKQAILSVIALQRLGQEPELISLGERNDFHEMIVRQGIRLHKITERGILRSRKLLTLIRHLREERFDVVHCFNIIGSSYGRLAGWIVGVPRIFGGARTDEPASFFVNLANRLLNCLTSRWITNAESCKSSIIRDLHVDERDVFVVRNAMLVENQDEILTREDARRKFSICAHIPCITMIANLRPEKNHEMFLRVARRILDFGMEASFLVAGDGPRRSILEQMSRSMNLEDRVRFMGQCDHVNELLTATDVVLHTSLFEGTPNSLIEAGAQGIPCVACASGGILDVIVDGLTGFLVPPNDDDLMVQRTLRLLSDEPLRIGMGEEARQHVVSKYSLEMLGHNLLKVYEGERGQNP